MYMRNEEAKVVIFHNVTIAGMFGLGAKEKAKASRLLTSAVDGGYIKVMDPDTATRYKKYIPYWA